jgi:uncharacterized protein with von Willebrand factor type A (vWA) domain
MTPLVDDEQLIRLFQHLRAAGLPLGIQELLAAQRLVAADTGRAHDDQDRLRRRLQLVWCKSVTQQLEFEQQWQRLRAQQQGEPRWDDDDPATGSSADEESAASKPNTPTTDQAPEPVVDPGPGPAPVLRPLPLRAPEGPAPVAGDDLSIDSGPVSRRSMAYLWRHLRRPVKDGPCDRLNLVATVERAARQGFFDRPVLERRYRDHGRLLLLVDQGGSMVPFHRLNRDLVETLADAGIGQVDIGYFNNVPADQVYADPHRSRPIELAQRLTDCDPESGVLIVSDAGAARGGREQSRFRATVRMLVNIKRHTTRVGWLNPVPAPRWPGSTAQLIAAVVPMFPLDEDGFAQAVDVLRGQAGGGGR